MNSELITYHTRNYNFARRLLIFWTLFVGMGAYVGGIAMLIKPDGSILQMQPLLQDMQKLPFGDVLFQDYIFSGIMLIIVNGISNTIAAILILKKKYAGVVFGCIFGVTLMLWICIQFCIFEPNILDNAYFTFGALQFTAGWLGITACRQLKFDQSFNEDDYKNFGTDKSRIVIFYSRTGHAKKLAYETAEKTGAELFEVKAIEYTKGLGGFWWCGRFGMHGWAMPVEEPEIDFSQYRHITICTPVWVFGICAPMKDFCRKVKGQIREFDLVLNHFNTTDYKKLVSKMEKELGAECRNFRTVSCHMNRIAKENEYAINERKNPN